MENSEHIETKSAIPLPPEPLIKQGWLRALVFVLTLPVYLILQSLVMIVITGFDPQSTEGAIPSLSGAEMIAAYAASLAFTLLYVWMFRHFIDRRRFISLGLSFSRRIRADFLAGIFWGGGMAVVVFAFLWTFGLVSIERVQFPIGNVLVGAVTFLLVAAQEELLTRGYLLNNLMQSANKYLSLLIVSIVFSIGHILNPNFTLIGLLNIILAGFYLGIYYIYRQNLWFPIGIHFAWNWFQGSVFGSPVSGFQMQSILVVQFNGSESLSGGGFGFEGSLVMTIVAMLTVILLHFIYRQPRNEPESIIPESPQPEQK